MSLKLATLFISYGLRDSITSLSLPLFVHFDKHQLLQLLLYFFLGLQRAGIILVGSQTNHVEHLVDYNCTVRTDVDSHWSIGTAKKLEDVFDSSAL